MKFLLLSLLAITGLIAVEVGTEADECTVGMFSLEDLCYYSCETDTDGVRRYSSTATDIATVFGDKEAYMTMRQECAKRNSELTSCAADNIVPNVDSYSKDRVNCGCGKCVERCEFAQRYQYYKNSEDVAKCTKIACSVRDATVTAATALTGTNEREIYYNIRRDIVETDVELRMCTDGHFGDRNGNNGNNGTTETPTDPCDEADPCEDGEEQVCAYDSDGAVHKTFKCAIAYHCAVRDAVTAGSFKIAKYGACPEATTDACVVGTIRVIDDFVATSKCPRICKCIANPKNSDFGNVEICDTLQRNFENLKKLCATKFPTDCVFANMYFSACPTTADPCVNLFCGESTTNDPSVGGVCRFSAEKFGDSGVSVRDNNNGCTYQECDKESTSLSFGELVEKRYDENTVDSKGILFACPRLADCRALTYDTNDLCGVCPTCGDEPDEISCVRNTLRRGDFACLDDPELDDTRVKADGSRTEFVGKVGIELASRFCADEFFGYTRSEIYSFIKTAAYTIAGECTNVEVDALSALRAYISAFDFESVDKLETDECDTMIKVLFRVDLCDIDLERLKKLLVCFEELRDNESVDIRARIATEIKENTKDTRFSSSTTSEDPTLTNGDGVFVAAAAANADVFLTDMDGNLITYDVATTVEGECTDCKGSNGSRYTIIVSVMLSLPLVVMLF